MSASDGSIVGTTLILDNGRDIQRFNIAVLSEGYQTAQLGQFATDAAAFVSSLGRTYPFHLVMNAINVFRVDVSSTDTAADDPLVTGPPPVGVICAGSGTTARTYFDATFCGDGSNQRLLTVNQALALQVATAQVPRHRLVVVIVNSTMYGGSGGGVAVYSVGAPIDAVLHEIGHTVFRLADEYEYLRGCTSGELDRNNHPTIELDAVNATVIGFNNRVTLKWGRYVHPGTALPTTRNASSNCANCDPQASPVPAGTVGAFEGADYYHCSAYRPEFNCKMRTLSAEFCRICAAEILNRLRLFSSVSLRFAWKGVGGDQTLYTGRGNDSDQDDLSDRGSSTGPALVDDNGAFKAWKGIFRDQDIYYSQQRHIDGVTWEQQRRVSGVGTSTGPALAKFRDDVHMAWKGIEGDQGIYFTIFANGIPIPQRNVPGVGTSTRPALAAYGGRLYMAWKGIEGDQGIWIASFDGDQWSAQAPVLNVGTSTYPALAVLGDRLYMVWKGIAGDESMWFTSFDGSRWQPQAPIPNVGTSTGASLSSGPDRLFMVWSGITGDPSIYYTTFDGQTWGRQHNYYETGSSAVPAVLAIF